LGKDTVAKCGQELSLKNSNIELKMS
jgi:hypothetical protein